VYKAGKLDVLKAAAIYGANGAGKSNLIKAFEFFQSLAIRGNINDTINTKKFKLNKSNKDKPVTFEIELSIGKKIYSYGITMDNLCVSGEWLYESGITVDDKLIFERKQLKSGKTAIKVSDKYRKTQKQKYLIELMEEKLLKSDELFLGKTDTLNIEEIDAVRKYIERGFVIIFPGSKFQNLVPMVAMSDSFKKFADKLLQTFDTGVSELGIETTDFEKFFGNEDDVLKKDLLNTLNKEKRIVFDTQLGLVMIIMEHEKYVVKKVVAKHKKSDGESIYFDLIDESDGTQRLLDLIPAFDLILQEDVTFIIDEIDQSLHPALIKELVRKIMSDDSTKGQMIFTTHESNLLDLDIFRQDEIWFAEKDKNSGSTQLYSLSEFKPRYDLDIRKGYLKGRFGAIPFLASLTDLKWH
jgi:AAA15 family ATPase/GTPase